MKSPGAGRTGRVNFSTSLGALMYFGNSTRASRANLLFRSQRDPLCAGADARATCPRRSVCADGAVSEPVLGGTVTIALSTLRSQGGVR